MGAASLLLFVLAGAFVFMYRCHYTSYVTTRAEGRQLLLLVGAVAVGLVLFSRFLLWIGEGVAPTGVRESVERNWNAAFAPFDIPDLPIYFVAFLLGPSLAFLTNRAYSADKASSGVIERYGTEIEKLLFNAMKSNSMVLVTLQSRKVYVGWPVYSPGLRRETKDFRILPTASGYRKEQTLELCLTTQYMDAYDKVKAGEIHGLVAEDFETVLPLEDVTSANRFELDIDQDIFKIRQDDKDQKDSD